MSLTRRRRIELVASIALFYVALWLLWLTPVVFPLKIFVVLLHEISHALAALTTGGSVERIVLNANEGGATYARGGNAFLILSAGYLGSLLWGVLLIELGGMRPERARRALLALAAFTVVIALVFVRNIFGFVFTALFGATLFFAARRLPSTVVGAVLLALGLTSALYAILDIRSDILVRSTTQSDAAMLATMTGIPALVWGLLWTVIALGVCWAAFRRWLRRV